MSLMKKMAEMLKKDVNVSDDFYFYVAFPKGTEKPLTVNGWVEMVKEYNDGGYPNSLSKFTQDDEEILVENLDASTEEGEWFFAVVMKNPTVDEYMVSYVDWNHMDQKNDYSFDQNMPVLASANWVEISRDDFNTLSGKGKYAEYLINDMLQYMN